MIKFNKKLNYLFKINNTFVYTIVVYERYNQHIKN